MARKNRRQEVASISKQKESTMTCLKQALQYEQNGWSVIQLKARDKAPRFDWKEFQSRRATPDEIELWWKEYPKGNVGIVTGSVSGIAVIDIDNIAGADDRFKREMPTGYQVFTGGGNLHAYYKIPNGIVLPSKKLFGIEIKAEGAQVVAPPSIHPSGKPYRFKQSGDMQPLPQWFIDIVLEKPKAKAEKSGNWTVEYWQGFSEGERNIAATKLVGHYFRVGIPKAEVITIMRAWNDNNDPPLNDEELLTIIHSIDRTHQRNYPETGDDEDITFHFDKNAEIAVLGIALQNNALIPYIKEKIGSDIDAFAISPHKLIYNAILSIDGTVDAITVTSRLREQHKLQDANNVIPQLTKQQFDSNNIADYCSIVKRFHTKRQLVSAGKKISLIPNEDIEPAEMLVKAQQQVMDVSGVVEKRKSIKEQCDEAFTDLKNKGEDYMDIPSGFMNFDYKTGGFERKLFYIIAGLPSLGKSAFIHNILYYISVEKLISTALFTYESNAKKIIQRMISISTGVDLTRGMKPADEDAVLHAVTLISKSPLTIIDDIDPSVETAIATTQRLKAENPDLAVGVYDHMHLMTTHSKDNEEGVVRTISHGLKTLAKQVDMAIVGISQLSRASIRRQDSRPTLSDLRHSGALEADADLAAFLYREDYQEEISDISPTELIIRKQKDGEIGTLYYDYHRKLSKFTEA